jgi:hypothetical protein
MFVLLDVLNNKESFLKKSVGLFQKVFAKDLNEDKLACEVIMNSQKTSSSMEKKVNSVESNEICRLQKYIIFSEKCHQIDFA